jgi:beta-lactamase class A
MADVIQLASQNRNPNQNLSPSRSLSLSQNPLRGQSQGLAMVKRKKNSALKDLLEAKMVSVIRG